MSPGINSSLGLYAWINWILSRINCPNDPFHLFLHYLHYIRAPPRGGRDWKIHPRRPRFPETQEISRGRSPREISRVEGNLERFPAAMGFAPRDPRDFPRAKPEGNPEGRGVQNPRPRKISRAEGMDFPIPPESWWSTDILSSLPGKDWSTAPMSPSGGSF